MPLIFRSHQEKQLLALRRVIHQHPNVDVEFTFSPSRRDSLMGSSSLGQTSPCFLLVPRILFSHFSTYLCPPQTSHNSDNQVSQTFDHVHSSSSLSMKRSYLYKSCGAWLKWQYCTFTSNAFVTMKTDGDIVRFCVDKPAPNNENRPRGKQTQKRVKMSKRAKINELRLYRLKAKKKMRSPNPEVRIRYKLGKAKRKEEWLIEKLRKFEIPKSPEQVYDPEILTEEERFYLKRTGEKKNNYVPVGRRGVFGGVVLNMHLHWKKHETVKVICKPCRPGQVHQYAEELARLSKGIVIDIKPNNTIIFYRGKNYVQPEIMSPLDTLSKQKALEKYRFEQSLEHTSQFIEKLEKELEEYQKHLALFRKGKEEASTGSPSHSM